jgi:hypothetical protein
MNKVVISRSMNSRDLGKINTAFYVVSTPLSVSEFDSLFRKAITSYLDGWKACSVIITQKMELSWASAEHDDKVKQTEAGNAYIGAIKSQEQFIADNKIFEYEGQKILLTLFIENKTFFVHDAYEPADFTVLSVEDWAEMKLQETTTGFTLMELDKEEHTRKTVVL